MLFSSSEFIFVFLPITLLGYYFISKKGEFIYAKIWLLLASLIFYAYWNPINILIIVLSLIVNYLIGKSLYRNRSNVILIIGIVINLSALGYYKYADFFISNINLISGGSLSLLHIVLPLGISFFTFQQVGFLVDNYEGKVPDFSFSDYCLFVTFFPQLIAGPIVHHSEMMPQFADSNNRALNWQNIVRGIFIFNMGLAKKLVIADSLALIVTRGYSNAGDLSMADSWITSIFYSLQLYFDFSGYSDMAIGLGLLFNIRIPMNFNSPYKSVNIQEFWRRWHVTLSRFLRDYIYIPLGGSKRSEATTIRNLLLTFLIGGFWHGAGWTFIVWGGLHGLALGVHRFFSRFKFAMPVGLGIMLTFLFVNVTWVFFRSNSWEVAVQLLSSMLGLNSGNQFTLINDYYNLPIWIIAIFLLFGRNTNEIGMEFSPNFKYGIQLVLLIILNLLFLNSSISQEFLYFDF